MAKLYKIATIELNSKRPPSHAMIMRMAGVYMAAGHGAIDLQWRGQTIELTYHGARGAWYGQGSIGNEYGDNVADELNHIRRFVLDHFQIIKVGENHV
jgi:hypothetical protein